MPSTHNFFLNLTHINPESIIVLGQLHYLQGSEPPLTGKTINQSNFIGNTYGDIKKPNYCLVRYIILICSSLNY